MDNDNLNKAGQDIATSMATHGISSLFSFGLDQFAASRAEEAALHNSKELMRYQQGLQTESNLRAMTEKRHSLERAGLNINAEQGFQPTTAVPGLQGQGFKANGRFDFGSLAEGSAFANSMSQARLNNANADRILYDLDKEKSADEFISNVHQDDSGNFVIDLPVIANTKQFDVLKDVSRWNGEKIAIDAKCSQDALSKAIADGQLQSNEFIDACVNMKPKEYENLLATIAQSKAYRELINAQKATEKQRKEQVKAQTENTRQDTKLKEAQTATENERKELVVSEKALTDLQKTLQGNQDFATMMSKMEGKDFGDKAILFLGWVFEKITGMVSIGKKF